MGNPFSMIFGKKPGEYIVRSESIDEIKTAFLGCPPRSQTYLINGVRGSGKTVLMTAITQEIAKEKDWVCVDLNSALNLIEDLSYRLADASKMSKSILDRGVDVSVAGFGVGIGEKQPQDAVGRCEAVLTKLKRQRKKLLIAIDEVVNDQSMKQFASQFQIWVRKEYEIFLLMTGLHENISAIQNNPQLTFLLRSPKITLGPLVISQIARKYEKNLDVSDETALLLAKKTKGYAFAFQALGMLCYDSKGALDIDNLLKDLDGYLEEYVYRKIWNGLSEQERRIITRIPDEGELKVKDICDALEMRSGTFSKYRERLLDKGLIVAGRHGYIGLALPRFNEVCKYI